MFVNIINLVIGVVSPSYNWFFWGAPFFGLTLLISLGLPSSEWEGIDQNPKLTWNLMFAALGKGKCHLQKASFWVQHLIFCGGCRKPPQVCEEQSTVDENPENQLIFGDFSPMMCQGFRESCIPKWLKTLRDLN